MKKILVVYALKDEFVPITLTDCQIQYLITGIGKANAAMKLTEAVMSEKYDLILNLGTVGTIDRRVGEILVCNKFVDRDLLPLVNYGVTAKLDLSNSQSAKDVLQSWNIEDDKLITCNTGDTFISDLTNAIEGEIIDMEAFALASVCKTFDLPFISVKYVTDIVGQNSVEHWEAKLADARQAIEQWFLSK